VIASHCHPELVSGSGFYLLGCGGPLTGNAVFISDQRVLDFKRTAILRKEMLKQVHDAERGVSIKGYGVS